jgi:tetratricopeptide (TPR) repeat protein
MPSIFYHNHEDIVSMVGLAERLYGVFGRSGHAAEASTVELHGLEWLALGCCYEGLEDWPRAEEAFRQALDGLAGSPREIQGRAEAFRRLGQLQKQQGRWQEAAETWQLWLSSVPGTDPTPYVELAKYCEWQAADLEQAAMWTGWALHNLRTAPARQRSAAQIAELEHRLERLERKRQG